MALHGGIKSRRFIDTKKVIFSVDQEEKNVLKLQFEDLNNRFFNFIEIAFWGGQEVENELALPCNH